MRDRKRGKEAIKSEKKLGKKIRNQQPKTKIEKI